MDKVTEQAIVDAFDLDQHYGPREIASLFAACARLATPAPDSEKLREAAKPFVAHWQPWMGDREYHKDDDEMSCFARVTFGQLRDLRAILGATS